MDHIYICFNAHKIRSIFACERVDVGKFSISNKVFLIDLHNATQRNATLAVSSIVKTLFHPSRSICNSCNQYFKNWIYILSTRNGCVNESVLTYLMHVCSHSITKKPIIVRHDLYGLFQVLSHLMQCNHSVLINSILISQIPCTKSNRVLKFGFNTINSPELCLNNMNLRKVLMQSNVVAYWILVSDEFEFLICYILGHFIIRSNFRILLMMDSSVIVFHLIGWVCSKEYSFFQSLLQKHFYTEKSSHLKGLLNLRET